MKSFDYAWLITILISYCSEIYPPEVIQTYGNMDDWHNVVGTGAFMLKDYVPASSMTFQKNTDYWGYDEVHPQNRLPYVDNIKCLIIPDEATRLTAMRTGQGDFIAYDYPEWRTAEQMKKTNPDMQFGPYYGGVGSAIYMQLDTKPFDDIKVRRALQMSIDLQSALDVVWGPGGAGKDQYTSTLSDAFPNDLYTSFKELPAEVQENFTYNPTKAKQLLAEAGYPNGFKMEVLSAVGGSYTPNMPFAVDYFSKIGVQMEIVLKEASVVSTQTLARTYPQAVSGDMGSASSSPTFNYILGPGKWERHSFQDAEDLYAKAISTVDIAERNKLLKQLNVLCLQKVMYIGVVVHAPKYDMAQPWVRGWHGELMLRIHDIESVVMRLWLDPDIKKAKR